MKPRESRLARRSELRAKKLGDTPHAQERKKAGKFWRGDDGLPWYVYLIVGDEYAMGTDTLANATDPIFPEGFIPRAFIYDRTAQRNRFDETTRCSIRSLSEGYGAYSVQPWMTGEQNIGIEWSMAHCLTRWVHANHLFIKLAVGSSGFTIDGDLNWNVCAPPEDSLTNGYLYRFYSEAMRELMERIGQDYKRVRQVMGVSSLGAHCDVELLSNDYANFLDFMRSSIRTGSPADVPWLIMQTPYNHSEPNKHIGEVHHIQEGLGRAYRTWAKPAPQFDANRPVNFAIDAGIMAAKWATLARTN